MKKIIASSMLGCVLTVSGCAAGTHKPKIMTARSDINGLSRQKTHDGLIKQCMGHGDRIEIDTMSTIVCAKQMDSSMKSILYQALATEAYSSTPDIKVQFNFVPTSDGVMHINATGWVEHQNAFGKTERQPIQVNDVQTMLDKAKAGWYQRHPEFASKAAS